MIYGDGGGEPVVPTGSASRPARLARPVTLWRTDAVGPDGMAESDRGFEWDPPPIAPLHTPISAGSAPGSNPLPTGWRCIGLGLTGAKPDVFEWAALGGKRKLFLKADGHSKKRVGGWCASSGCENRLNVE